MKKHPHGLSALLCAALGADWPRVHPDIRRRFTLTHTNIDHDNFRVEINLDHP